MGIIVGAYAASPSQPQWRPDLEADYFSALADVDSVRGLELPWVGRLHPHDGEWLLSHLPAAWDLVVTDVGGTVGALAADPAFGLASPDEQGRLRAVATVGRMRDDVDRINQRAGRAAVIAVELHSAPLGDVATPDALARSLREIAAWQWGSASLVVEHCDAFVAHQTPEKGYLSLTDEITGIRASGVDVGISLNWGRSAVELRDADRVVDHVTQAVDAGLLRSIVFSGASSEANAYGQAWADSHLPFDVTEPTSLLTAERAHAALAAAPDLDWVGIKLGYRPLDAPVAERVRAIERTIALLGG